MPRRPRAEDDGHGVIHVLVAGDEAHRARVRVMLGSDAGILVVGEAGTDEDALALAQQLKPHVVLIDSADRLHVLASANRLLSDPALDGVQVLMFGRFVRDEHVLAAWRSGIGGLVDRDIAPADLAQAVRISATGAAFFVSSRRSLRRR